MSLSLADLEEAPMDPITLSVEIPPDRHLVLDLPADTPVGRAAVIIKPQSALPEVPINPAREAARSKLLAAGSLVTDIHAPVGAVALSNEELEQIGQLASGARSSEELLDEERGKY
jgi:hypothetical protein